MMRLVRRTAALAVFAVIAGGLLFASGGQEAPAAGTETAQPAKNINLSGEGTLVQRAMQSGLISPRDL